MAAVVAASAPCLVVTSAVMMCKRNGLCAHHQDEQVGHVPGRPYDYGLERRRHQEREEGHKPLAARAGGLRVLFALRLL